MTTAARKNMLTLLQRGLKGTLRLLKRRWKLLLMALLVLVLSLIYLSNELINSMSAYCYDRLDSLPPSRAGLVLGTAKYSLAGGENHYYRYRLQAAAELYNSGLVRVLICSGDNSTVNYDEPSTMKRDLVKMGIPADRIYLDYAGFRTLDSVVRAKAIFSQDKFIVVSQEFHNERAVYIARCKGMEAYGFNAKDVSNSYGLKTRFRELLARVKTILDVHLLGTDPHFYGEKVPILLEH